MILRRQGMRSAFAATVALSIPFAAYAQAPAATNTTAPAADDETIMLSPFEIKETADRGYVSSESMTGSRVAVKIIDLPYTVNVLTSEFFEDFGLLELGDNLTQVGNFTGLDIGGGFNLRGFSSSSQLRDGFYRLGRYGSSNIDRMEIIKGSNAAIYGRTSPGGMINMISKQPKNKESQKLTLTYGDYETRRGVLEATGPLVKSSLGTTTYIVTLSQYVRGFDQKGQDFARNRNNEAYLALKHTFPDSSSLFFSAEYFLQVRHAPPSAAPLIIDNKGTTDAVTTNPAPNTVVGGNNDVALGYAKNLADYNAAGPNSELNRGNVSLSLVYEKKLSPIFTTRLAGNYFRARRWDYNAQNWGAITYNASGGATPTSARGNPNKGLIFEDGGGTQMDLLARYKLGNVSNQTLVTVDINDYYRYDPTWNYGANTQSDIVAWQANPGRVINLDSNYNPTETIDYFGKKFQWGEEVISRYTNRRTTSWGGLLRHQSNFLNEKLLAFAGARFDRVEFRHRDYFNTRQNTIGGRFYDLGPDYKIGQLITRTVNELKPNAGVNYKLTRNLRTFINYSESYFVNQTDNPDVIADNGYKSEVADGWDYGFKGEFFDGGLNFTVSGFYATRSNVRVSELVDIGTPGSPNFQTINRADGDQLVRGVEADVTWRVNDSITTGLSYGHTNSIYTDFGSASPQSKYRKVNNISPHNGSTYIKWAPGSGRLKGFSANLGVSYVSATRTEAPNAGDLYINDAAGNRVFVSSNNAWAIEVPSFTIWNAGVRYTLKGSNRIDHTFAINVNNLTDEDYLKVNRQLGDRRTILFTYTIGRFGE